MHPARDSFGTVISIAQNAAVCSADPARVIRRHDRRGIVNACDRAVVAADHAARVSIYIDRAAVERLGHDRTVAVHADNAAAVLKQRRYLRRSETPFHDGIVYPDDAADKIQRAVYIAEVAATDYRAPVQPGNASDVHRHFRRIVMYPSMIKAVFYPAEVLSCDPARIVFSDDVTVNT